MRITIVIRSMFRHPIILVDIQNLTWKKKNPVRHVGCLWKALNFFSMARLFPWSKRAYPDTYECVASMACCLDQWKVCIQLLTILKSVLLSSGTENTRFQRFASRYHCFISEWVCKRPFLNPMLHFGKLFLKNCVCLTAVVSWGRVWL